MNVGKESGDLRSRRTRKLLHDALLALLKERDLEAISVKDICERAMIHRTTFYKHYVDKYDLLNREMAQMFKQLSEGIPTPTEAVVISSSGEPPEHFVRLFQHAAENPTFYSVMLASGRTSAFRKLVEDYLAKQSQVRIRALIRERQGVPLTIPEDLLVRFSIGAVEEVLVWWLEQKTPPPPVEMARHMARLIYYGMLPVLGIDTGTAIKSGE